MSIEYTKIGDLKRDADAVLTVVEAGGSDTTGYDTTTTCFELNGGSVFEIRVTAPAK